MDQRLTTIHHWLASAPAIAALGIDRHAITLEPASSDASFRRYFRLRQEQASWIVMDAPPPHEAVAPFIKVAQALAAIGLNVPQVLAADRQQGLLLLTDLGDQPLLQLLTPERVDRLYGDALGALAILQSCGPLDLPPYDEPLLLREMALFSEWYLQRHLGLSLSEREQQQLGEQFALLAARALAQPQVPVHRDYHARNLMYHRHNPAILDFQDAVIGPVTYDLVSLLRDCYIAWPADQVEAWALGYHELALQHGILQQRDEARFLHDFDWMGVQRHLKAVGIFARLWHRDGKSGYLDDIPRTLSYLRQVCGRYEALAPLSALLERCPAV